MAFSPAFTVGPIPNLQAPVAGPARIRGKEFQTQTARLLRAHERIADEAIDGFHRYADLPETRQLHVMCGCGRSTKPRIGALAVWHLVPGVTPLRRMITRLRCARYSNRPTLAEPVPSLPDWHRRRFGAGELWHSVLSAVLHTLIKG